MGGRIVLNVTDYLAEETVPSAAQWNEQFMRKKRAAPPNPDCRTGGLVDFKTVAGHEPSEPGLA
eukprot:CAMPEP_0114685574 /NCGR_PEP_ID=MMETSP0191-20121206/60619_1 /TAXON_ID=126664 /ORGANISM="Sorites sp." /LENGTH=63 /DNA_ID=CAMNT_0001970203 /DNA_START=1 /DNA_END=189 /DNA_ORIENTATION=+